MIPAHAVSILNPGDILRVTFTVTNSDCPGGPCDVIVGFANYDTAFFILPGQAALYDGSTLLGTYTGNSAPNFRAATSLFGSHNAATIDFTSITNRTIQGRIDFTITGGQAIWNGTPSLSLTLGRAQSAGFVLGDVGLTVTSGEIISGVPEPSTAALWGLSSLLAFHAGYAVRRRRAKPVISEQTF